MFAVSSVSTILANSDFYHDLYVLFPSDSFDFLIQTSIILVQNLLYPESLNPLTWKPKPKMIKPQGNLQSQSVWCRHPWYELNGHGTNCKSPNHLTNYEHLKLRILKFSRVVFTATVVTIFSFRNTFQTFWKHIGSYYQICDYSIS